MRVLLTRNDIHNMLLKRAIKSEFSDQKVDVVEAPLLEQVPIVESVENLSDFLHDLQCEKNIDDVIFISPSAVEFGAKKIFELLNLQRVFAVGKGTANMLENQLRKMALSGNTTTSLEQASSQPMPIIFPKQGAGSKALLALAELQDIQHRQILIVTGAQGKPYLENELLKKGANVNRWECYQRQKPTQLNMQLKTLFTEPLDYVLLHSVHAATHFLEEMPVDVSSDSIGAIVGAQTIADKLISSGWLGSVQIAVSPTPKDMLLCLKECTSTLR